MIRFLLGCILLFVSLSCATAAENLLVNGSFEEGIEPKRYTSLGPGSEAIKGWKVTRGFIDYQGTFLAAAEGKRSIDLHGTPGLGGVQQTFATKKGAKYRVSLAIRRTNHEDIQSLAIGVTAVGDDDAKPQTTSFEVKVAKNWETKAWEFVAESDQAMLEIYTLVKATNNSYAHLAGPAIDDVSVVEVLK